MNESEKTVRQLSLKEAKAAASQLATEFLLDISENQFGYSVTTCFPSATDPKPVGKTPTRWIAVADVSSPEPNSVIDGGELFINVDLVSKKVSWIQNS